MSIRMIGIDHNKASIEEREVFSFTKTVTEELLLNLKSIEGIYGCIILSTCNRMELWLSCNEEYSDSIYELLCFIQNIDSKKYSECFVERNEQDAIDHLFYLTCGMKSQIIGEDQILTQVKSALDFSREHYCTDNVLEVLFRMAITSAKKVKTDIHLSMANSSIIHHVIHELRESEYDIDGKKCMVIGNGEMGKLAATKLKEEGAEVTVTVRQYRSGMVDIPKGCNRINYGERLDHILSYDMIISATSSPNTTLKYEHLSQMEFDTPKLFIDLAVPRDMEPEIGTLNNVTLYDIDQFHVEPQSAEMKAQMMQIEEILRNKIDEFNSWYDCKDIIPIVQTVSENAAIDVQLRIDKTINKLGINKEDKKLLEESIQIATNKVLSKLMFGIRDSVSADTFQECVEAMKQIY